MTSHALASASPLGPRLPGRLFDGTGLKDHLQACGRARGRAFGLRCIGERLHDLVAPRVVTTVFAVAALLALAGWV